jgi:hypothetical protein
MTRRSTAALLALTLSMCAAARPSVAQSNCTGTPLAGTIRDNSQAVIPGVTLTLDNTSTTTSAPDGHFRFACVTPGSHDLTANAIGFATLSMKLTTPRPRDLDLHLTAGAEISITVEGDGGDDSSAAPGSAGGTVLAGKQLQALADDPDDLLRELQQLAAASGGSPGSTTISVDGFQDSSQLPPKDSIAFINVSPDLFSAEYREPPFGGGRVEVYTKPGARSFHGSIFSTNSSSWMNARDPFTLNTGSIGKQRYGFTFTGPILKKGSNFSLNLEHRSIDETVAVNAITLDGSGNQVNTLDTVPVPQRLWIGNARVDWQLGPKNIAFASYSANVTDLQNLGAGGQTLRSAGYNAGQNDQIIRVSDVTTISPQLVHESRASFEHYNEADIPFSTGPSISVAGYFTSGGATIGNARNSRSRVEFDDDIILNTKKHLIKTGVQLFWVYRDSLVPTNFNGQYIFSGAGTGAAYISPLQQYQQATTVGGTATEFNNVVGNPEVKVSQVRLSVFYQDNLTLSEKWKAFYGLRYYAETDPANYNSIAPRGGFSFTPDKKKTLILTSHFGLFNGEYNADNAQELHREDGVQRITSLIYNPSYGSPFTGATPIHSMRTLAPGFNQSTYAIGDFSASKDLPFGFNINAQEVFLRFLTYARTVNINQPLTASPFGPRPYGANLNILQAQNNGTGQGHGEFIGLSNFKLKHVQFFIGGLHLNIRDNTNDSLSFQPQSAYTDAGEQANRSNQGRWQLFGNANVSLPWKLSLSSNGYANSGNPFNITTGSDNNGDGTFNDRPQYAAPGAVVDNTTVFNTRFGVLTNNGPIINGIPLRPIQRNIATLPWSFHLDANLQRAFKLTKDPKATHQQTVTANIRSANFLNHTNVTAAGSVLNSSPQFLAPVTADTARRIEFGLRYAF